MYTVNFSVGLVTTNKKTANETTLSLEKEVVTAMYIMNFSVGLN